MHSMEKESYYRARIIEIISGSGKMMDILKAANSLSLSEWCVGAGAIRNFVWDYLHGNDYRPPRDIDLVYYDAVNDLSRKDVLEKLNSVGGSSWEVTNQARVHDWYVGENGEKYEQFKSLLDGISTWPEYCTAIGVALDKNNELVVYAPFGLQDLFNMKVRHNPRRASHKTYADRALQKFCTSRWPKVQIIL